MMKKELQLWLSRIASVLLLDCVGGGSGCKPGAGKSGIEVYGSCQSSKNYYEIMLGVTGMDTVDLPGGITLSGESDSKADDELRVVIIPADAVKEPEAYAWLSSSAVNLGQRAGYVLPCFLSG